MIGKHESALSVTLEAKMYICDPHMVGDTDVQNSLFRVDSV